MAARSEAGAALIDFRFSGTTDYLCVLESARVELSSSVFAAGQPISHRYSADEEDLSPPLEWRSGPADAVSLALIVDDPDAPVGTCTHCLALGDQPG